MSSCGPMLTEVKLRAVSRELLASTGAGLLLSRQEPAG